MNDNRPAHERRIKIEWTAIGYGVQLGRIEDPPGWLFVKESLSGVGGGLFFVRDVPVAGTFHNSETCHVCRDIANGR